MREGVLFVDVRTPAEFARRHHEKTINIPLNEIEQRINKFPINTHIVLICSSGTRSMMAKKKLEKYGHKKTYNFGGLEKYEESVEKRQFLSSCFCQKVPRTFWEPFGNLIKIIFL